MISSLGALHVLPQAWLTAAAPILVGAAFAISSPAHAQPAVTTGKTVVVGRISANPRKQHPRLEAMADYLARKLGRLGYTASKVVIASEPEEMSSLMARGEVDLISETPFTALAMEREIGARLLLHEWKNGEAFYKSVIFSRQETRIFGLGDMKNQKIAFEDRGSTSAFLVPFAMLHSAGLELRELDSPVSPVPLGTVGYTFALREKNIVVLVGRGTVSAGAFSRSDWEDFSRSPEAIKQNLRIVAESGPIVRSLLLVRGDLDQTVTDAVKELLLAAHLESEGKQVLRTYNKVAKFTELGVVARESLRNLRASVAAISDRNGK